MMKKLINNILFYFGYKITKIEQSLNKDDNFLDSRSLYLKGYTKNICPLVDFKVDVRRSSGNTTRLADECIQTLFNNGCVVIKDHHNSGGNFNSNLILFNIVMWRLEREHNLIALQKSGMIDIDHRNFKIRLTEKYPKRF